MESVKPPKRRDAAVLIPLICRGGEWHILFEVRSPEIRQGGEICFPGGRIEEGETGEETAIRETAEELLLRPEQIDVIAPMVQMSPGVTGNIISAYLGVLKEYQGTFSADEVEHVFSVPLNWFFQNPPLTYTEKMQMKPQGNFPFELIPGGVNYRWDATERSFIFIRPKMGSSGD